jgi:mono/diheme cytochrome c family protein
MRNPSRRFIVSRGIRSSRPISAAGPALFLSLVLGCGGEGKSPPAPAPAAPSPPAASAPAAGGAATTEAARAEAEQIFRTRCVTCHGPQGAGDGPASAGLTPPPRNFQDPAWQGSVSDAHIEQIVQYGGAAVGKSAAMPANPDLMSKPEVVAELRAYVRGLAP